jgi:tRNA-2-methylthio-N6-dimethylallyladenosine synthase
MRRGYTRREYLDRIDRLRQRCPEVALSTDIIVGFPGETDDQFEESLELLGQVEYDEIYSFMYSPRKQTVSAKLYDDNIPEPVKKERLRRVQVFQQEISLRKNKQKIGRIEEVLIDGHSRLKNGQVMGRTRTNRIVNLRARESLVGQLVQTRIIGATVNSLIGELNVQETTSEIQPQGEMA